MYYQQPNMMVNHSQHSQQRLSKCSNYWSKGPTVIGLVGVSAKLHSFKVLITEFLKVPNVPSILNWTFQMFLKRAVVSTNSNTHLFFAGTFKDRNVQCILILIEVLRGNNYPKVYSWSNTRKHETFVIKIKKVVEW